MKKFLLAAIVLGLVSSAVADIQAPPKSEYTSTRKLSRGLANILYCWIELPVTIWRTHETGAQSTEWILDGPIQGLERTGNRLVYGVYEVVNFRSPIYKDTFRPPYTSINYDPIHGYEEFPPQIGQLSTVGYTRGRSW
jgi:putative exosortase-associated protein (TIGR04073 family)